MNADPRIEDVDSIYTVLDTSKRPYTNREGYFADYLYDFRNLDNLTYGVLTEVDQKDEKPYRCNGTRCYRYFLPVLAVNTKLKVYTTVEDLPFKVGDVISLRLRKKSVDIISTIVTGIYLSVGRIEYICFCDFKLSPFELLNYEYSANNGTWQVCGIRKQE